MDIDSLPYRPCVGLMVLNGDGRIFAGQRLDAPAGMHAAWQMPQGGIDPGETPAQAALRELREETGISPSAVDILRESDHWRDYELPAHLVTKLWNGAYRGQTQRWFAIRYRGPDIAISIETEEPEFREWAWMAPDELVTKIVPFKRDTYTGVFDEFADLLKQTA